MQPIVRYQETQRALSFDLSVAEKLSYSFIHDCYKTLMLEINVH